MAHLMSEARNHPLTAGQPCALPDGHRGGHLTVEALNRHRARQRERQRERYRTDPEYRERQRERYRFRRSNDPELVRHLQAISRLSKYGLSLDEYSRMCVEQKGICAICDSPATQVDHDHETGQIRALLCARCNLAIGQWGEDPNRLLSAAAYLIQHKDIFRDRTLFAAREP